MLTDKYAQIVCVKFEINDKRAAIPQWPIFCCHGMLNNGCHGTTGRNIHIGLLTMNFVKTLLGSVL